jgi:2-dehydropantoate 2-reductase
MSKKIAVFGAGSIGCFVGGSLLAAGNDVRLIGRERMQAQLQQHGLILTDWQGRRHTLEPQQIRYATDASALGDADLILVTVKSAATPDAARHIAQHAKPGALVISLQNGIGNDDLLRATLPRQTVLGGMVPFNVVQMGAGRLHRGTEGELAIQAAPVLAAWQAEFARAGLPLSSPADFRALQWGKLLLNLNNPVNALANIPLKAELEQRAFRQCLAALIEEALGVLQQAGIVPARVAAVPAWALVPLLRLPNGLFRLIAGSMLKIDPEARSSMWEDLQAGRTTEIDYINGAVVQLAQQLGIHAPRNQKIIELIRQAEQHGAPSADGAQLLQTLMHAT